MAINGAKIEFNLSFNSGHPYNIPQLANEFNNDTRTTPKSTITEPIPSVIVNVIAFFKASKNPLIAQVQKFLLVKAS